MDTFVINYLQINLWVNDLPTNLWIYIYIYTGFKRIMNRSKQRQYNKMTSETKKKNLFEGEMRDILFHHKEFFFFVSKNLCDTSQQSSI